MRIRVCSELILPRRKLIVGAAALFTPRICKAGILGIRNKNTGQFKRPGIPSIDYSHPLAQGLILYAFDTGIEVLDLVMSRPAPPVPGTSSQGKLITPFGQSTFYNSTGVFFNSDTLIRSVTAAGSWTAACAYNISSFQGNPFGRTANNNGSQPFANWNFGNGGANSTTFNWNNGGLLGSFTWTGQQLNQYTSTAMVAAGTTSVLSYAQGALQNTSTGQTVASANTNDAVLVSGVSSAGAAGGIIGTTYYGGFWSRVLSAAEIKSLHFDPYQFLVFPEDQ